MQAVEAGARTTATGRWSTPATPSGRSRPAALQSRGPAARSTSEGNTHSANRSQWFALQPSPLTQQLFNHQGQELAAVNHPALDAAVVQQRGKRIRPPAQGSAWRGKVCDRRVVPTSGSRAWPGAWQARCGCSKGTAQLPRACQSSPRAGPRPWLPTCRTRRSGGRRYSCHQAQR